MADLSQIIDRWSVSVDVQIELEFDEQTWSTILLGSASTPCSPEQYLEKLLRHRMMQLRHRKPGQDPES